MTFKEYINQKDPLRQPIGSVLVDEDDCYNISKAYSVLNIMTSGREWAYVIELKIFNIYIEYLKPPHSNILHTMDEDGNRKGASVFKLNFKLEL